MADRHRSAPDLRDTNVVVNLDHPDTRLIRVEAETPVALDKRLFGP